MLHVAGTKVWAVWFALQSYKSSCEEDFFKHGPSAELPEEKKKFLREALPKILEELCSLGLSHAARRTEKLALSLIAEHILCVVVSHEIAHISADLIRDAGELKFVFVPPEKQLFFESLPLISATVLGMFPEAGTEIKDAGTCFALGLDTASVNHSMRAAELALRFFARKLKIKLKHAFEYADWGTIIGEIEKKLGALQQKPRGKRRTEAMEFYRKVQDQFIYFKDVWRHNSAHVRKRFNTSESIAVYNRVCELLTDLAEWFG